jgi:signal transduction histidine kinase
LPTTLRIALLAGLLALVSNLAVIGFIQWRTHDEAITTLRHEVVEQGAVLADVYRTGGMPALKDAIDDTVSFSDEQTAVGLFDSAGRKVTGNLARLPRSTRPLQEGYRSALLRFDERTTPQEAALFVHRLPNGLWLISGRASGEGLALRDTLERSLLIAVVLALLLGLACGLILAKYVDSRVRGIVAVTDRINARDLTQRVPVSGAGDAFDRLGQRINDMLDRISALMEELRLLTDSLAHDLRSPVSRLRAAADAASATSDPDERDQQLASVIRQADSLMRILTTILEISRSEALTGRNQFTQFDAGALGAELSEMYEPVAEEAGAALRFERAAGPLSLFGHRQLIAQAVSNLIENAIRYAALGGEIEVAVAGGGKTLRIEVADRGPGIPDERRSEALRRFGRLDSSRSEAGAGLGLALVRAIAHLHYGELVLEDNAPGLRAVLRLPVEARTSAGQPPDPSVDQSADSRA